MIWTFESIEAEVRAASAALQQFPRGLMGLTPDEVKASPEYQAAKTRYGLAFARLRKWNSHKRRPSQHSPGTLAGSGGL